LELEIKHKHGGFNVNYEKATVVWQQSGSDHNPNSSDNPVYLSIQLYGTYELHFSSNPVPGFRTISYAHGAGVRTVLYPVHA
jgi:hypothetical protein